MKRSPLIHTLRLGSLGFLLLLLGPLHAQGWKVDRFSSTVQLNMDGTIDVTENITVDFTESKRGIIRKLPFRYETGAVVDGETAAGHSPGVAYLTPMTGITVDNWNFALTKGYDAYEIKVGKSDEFLTGKQQYVIHYKVYGAINSFSKSQEFYWNVNGNDWDVDFDQIELNVLLPDQRRLLASDVAAFTGLVGSTSNTSVTKIEPGKVTVICTRRLGPHEGLTAVLRLPKGYLRQDPIPLSVRAEKYIIDSLIARMTVEDGGVIDVEERVVIDVIQSEAEFARILGKEYYGPSAVGITPRNAHYEVLDCWNRHGRFPEAEVYDLGAGYEATELAYRLTTGSIFPDKGKYTLRLHYKIYGTMTSTGNGVAIHIPWLNPDDHEPISYAKVRLAWKGNTPVDMKNVFLHHNAPAKGQVLLDKDYLQMEFAQPLESGQKVHFGIVLPNHKVDIKAIPLHVFDPTEYYQFYDVNLDIQPSGRIHVVNRFGMYRYTWYDRVSRPITLAYKNWMERPYSPGKPHFWGREGNYVVQNLDCNGELLGYDDYADHHLEIWGPKMLKFDGFDTLEYSYDIFGLLSSDGAARRLNFPLIETTKHSIDSIHFRIQYPAEKVLSQKDLALLVASGMQTKMVPKAAFTFRPGVVEGEIAEGMVGYNQLIVNLRLPDGAVSGSFLASLHLLWVNHKAVFLPIFFLIPLLMVWVFFGRNRRFTTVVEFYPPEDMTPTEAGLLIDDKLHNRDLLALIYYWGAQGYLTIKEIYGKDGGTPTDYQFTRLKKLPSTARKYEKTIFNALFAKGETTKVSSHKQQFYTYLATARGQVDSYAKSRNFYLPGTIGWSTAIKIAAWLVGIAALISLAMVLFQYSTWKSGRWEIPISWGLSTFFLFFFARIMPKRAPFGQTQYEKLMGFREFILRAEKEKLQQLMDTNPDYFGMTLPYAIALGIATKWVDQFGDLLTMPPSYYKTDPTVSTFQLAQFNRMMQLQLDQMAHTFNSAPPSSGGGGGGWGSSGSSSSSSSSSSYSSSGSSGSSGFSSGGGYSGGGYGGGGGSAW